MELPENISLFINIGLVVILIFLVYKGYKKGFISQIIGIFSLLLASIVAWILYLPFGKLFKLLPKNLVPFQSTSLHEFFYIKINSMLWFLIIFLITLIIIKFITKVLDVISKTPGINIINRFLGVVFSLVYFVLIAWLIIFGLSTPLFKNGGQAIDNSLLKYNQPVIEVVDELMINNPIKQLQSLQQIIKTPKQASTSDIENMHKWLLKNKVSFNDVTEFFKEIKSE